MGILGFSEEKYKILLDILFDNATLNYNKTDLYFDKEELKFFLRRLEPERYFKTLNRLKLKEKQADDDLPIID